MKKKLTLWTQGLKQQMQTLGKNELNQKDPCCLKFKMLLESGSTVVYLPQTRTYLLTIDGDITYSLHYCPCCGKEFPEDLTDKLTHIVYEELELDGYDDHRLPAQFKSDEWWQKGTIPYF
jgi:hypothetical protein